MNEDTEQYVVAGVVIVTVAALALWKGASTPAALAAIVSAGIVYFAVDQLMGRPQPAPPAVAAAQSAASDPPRATAVASPTITEDGAVVGMTGPAESSSHSSATLDLALLDPNSVEIDVASASSERPVWSVRISKHGQAIDECEDAVRIDHGRWVMAVADGASSSFRGASMGQDPGRRIRGGASATVVARIVRNVDRAVPLCGHGRRVCGPGRLVE